MTARTAPVPFPMFRPEIWVKPAGVSPVRARGWLAQASEDLATADRLSEDAESPPHRRLTRFLAEDDGPVLKSRRSFILR